MPVNIKHYIRIRRIFKFVKSNRKLSRTMFFFFFVFLFSAHLSSSSPNVFIKFIIKCVIIPRQALSDFHNKASLFHLPHISFYPLFHFAHISFSFVFIVLYRIYAGFIHFPLAFLFLKASFLLLYPVTHTYWYLLAFLSER